MKNLAWSFYVLGCVTFLLACATDNAYLASMTPLPVILWAVLLWRSLRNE